MVPPLLSTACASATEIAVGPKMSIETVFESARPSEVHSTAG